MLRSILNNSVVIFMGMVINVIFFFFLALLITGGPLNDFPSNVTNTKVILAIIISLVFLLIYIFLIRQIITKTLFSYYHTWEKSLIYILFIPWIIIIILAIIGLLQQY